MGRKPKVANHGSKAMERGRMALSVPWVSGTSKRWSSRSASWATGRVRLVNGLSDGLVDGRGEVPVHRVCGVGAARDRLAGESALGIRLGGSTRSPAHLLACTRRPDAVHRDIVT
ncbi:hypothetical protein GCM10009782_45840 [Glycomyces algeriensis]